MVNVLKININQNFARGWNYFFSTHFIFTALIYFFFLKKIRRNIRFVYIAQKLNEMKFIFSLPSIVFATILCVPLKSQEKTAKPLNVIFIICDDLNDYQGVFGGHPQAITPHMDQLAATAVQFVNAASNCPVCCPSRNSLFTGVYPHDSRDFGWTKRTQQPVLKHNKTIMQLFGENGYHLAGTGKLMHHGETNVFDEWGMDRSYNYGPFISDVQATIAHPDVPSPYREIGAVDGSFGDMSKGPVSPGTDKNVPGWVYGHDLKPFRYISDDDRDLLQDELHAQWAMQKLQEFEQNYPDRPFFLGIGFVKPHTPLHAPKKYFDMYPLEDLELAPWKDKDEMDTYYNNNFDADKKGPRFYRTLKESYNGNRELALKKFLQAYLACVSFVDDQIGKVIDALDQSVFKDNTIVIFTSDHGWQMGEKSFLFKNSAWEESARVPMVVRVPDSNPMSKVEHPVSLIDIYPTLVDYCNLQGSNKFSEEGGDLGGYSMRPFIENPELGIWDGTEGNLTMIGNQGLSTPVLQQNYSYRTKDWRYIHYADGSEELYNHITDKNEWDNLAYVKEYQNIKADLKSQVFSFLRNEKEPLFYDDFEKYETGTDLAATSTYQAWGQKATLVVSNSTSGLGVYEGNQYAETNDAWAAMVAPFSLKPGRTYAWSLTSKVEVDDPTDDSGRRRKMQVKSDDFLYIDHDVDNTVNDWVDSDVEFRVEPVLENINLIMTSPTNYPMGVDSFRLEETDSPYIRLYFDGEITEGAENGEIITIVLKHDTFSNPLSGEPWTINNLPPGVNAGSIERVNDQMAQIQLSENTTASYNGLDINDFSVTVTPWDLINSDEPLYTNSGIVFSALKSNSAKMSKKYMTAFKVYPNPAKDFVYIYSTNNKGAKAELFSLSGQLISRIILNENPQSFIVPERLEGIYLLRLSSDKNIETQKLIIE